MTEQELQAARDMIARAERIVEELKQLDAAPDRVQGATKRLDDWNTGQPLLTEDLLVSVIRAGIRTVRESHEKELAEMRFPGLPA